MKVAFTLLSTLLLRVSLIVLSETVGREEEDPGEKKREGDPDLQTIIIHADSSKTLQKNFDDLEDSGWLENWNVPLIIANSENGAKAAEVEKVQKRVKFLPGRFKNKKAVIHMQDEDKATGSKESVVESWILGDNKGPETGQGMAGPTSQDTSGTEQVRKRSGVKSGEKSTERTGNPDGRDQTTGTFSGPEDMEKDSNMNTIVIHSDTNAARQRYFDELEDSKAFDNWMVPRIITNAHNKTMRKQIKDFKNKSKMAFRGRFTNKQAVIHVRDDQIVEPDFEQANQDETDTTVDNDGRIDISRSESVTAKLQTEEMEESKAAGNSETSPTTTETPTTKTEDTGEDEADLNLEDAYHTAKFFSQILGAIEYYWIHVSSENVSVVDKPHAGYSVPWYFTSKTFVKTPNATYVFFQTFEGFDKVYKSIKLNETPSMDEQWNAIQLDVLKLSELLAFQFKHTLYPQPVIMGFWNEACENMEWAMNMKLSRSENLAHICLLHELRRSRFKFYTPEGAESKLDNCTKDPLSCVVTKNDMMEDDIRWHSLMTVDGADYHQAEYKNYSNTPIFFSSAGGYERLVVGYFVLKPEQENSKFNIFGGFLFAEALIAILAFGIIITALIFFSSGSTLRDVMFYMFAAVFEQGQRVPINFAENTRRAFFGKVVCFLWLLSWLILRQFLSGALVSNLTREDPPNTPTTNQEDLLDFLKKEGAILVEPLRRDESDWFQGSRDKLNNKTGKCWKDDFIKHIFRTDTEEDDAEIFPELKLMACIKSEPGSSDCEEFQNITVPYAFSYITTERRLETMKKLAKLVDKGIFVSTSNVETPFVKPNFFAPDGSNLLKPLLSKDFAKYFESGIFQKWQKLDEEMEGLAGCIHHASKENPDKFGNKTEEQIKETRRYCREVLDQDKKSGKDWIRRQLGKIDPVKFKEIKFPLLFLLIGNGLAFIVFLFEKFLPRRAVVWLEGFVEKIANIRDIIMRRQRVVRVYPQEFEMNERIQQELEVREGIDQMDTQEEGDQGNNHSVEDQPIRCPSPTIMEDEEKRLQFLLDMIDSYDRLVFSDEDLSLLKKSGVIMTDEEDGELKNLIQPNDTEVEMLTEGSEQDENDVQELPATDGPLPGMKLTEAWIETEQNGSGIPVEIQMDGESREPGPTRTIPGQICKDKYVMDKYVRTIM